MWKYGMANMSSKKSACFYSQLIRYNKLDWVYQGDTNTIGRTQRIFEHELSRKVLAWQTYIAQVT